MRPPDRSAIENAFHAAVNMTAAEVEQWLTTEQSKTVGWIRPGETESVGRQSARRIVAILRKPATELTGEDHAHMRKVVGYVRRHLAQRPGDDIMHTRWRYALMNWGHDPLKE